MGFVAPGRRGRFGGNCGGDAAAGTGKYGGPDLRNYLEMDGVSYVRRDSTPYGIQDKGKFLGLATDGVQEFCLYAVKGDEEGRYIYCFWDWEGFFYEKE